MLLKRLKKSNGKQIVIYAKLSMKMCLEKLAMKVILVPLTITGTQKICVARQLCIEIEMFFYTILYY